MRTGAAGKKAVVWLIEDHADSRRVLARVLNRAPTMQCPCAFASCEDALAALDTQPAPDVILLDVGLPGMSGIEGIRHLKARSPATHVIMLTVFDDQEKVFNAICAGASGYLLKTADEDAIANAVHEVLQGGSPINPRVARLVLNMFASSRATPPEHDYGLSGREREVLELMVQGLVKKEIADRLALSYHTVDNHLRSIYAKLQVHTRGGAVAKALSEHLVPPAMRPRRHLWFLLLPLCGAVLLLAGCRPQTAPPRRQLTGIYMTGLYAEAARSLAEEFTRQTGIQVNIVEANLFSLREKELTDLLTGGGHYDVLQVAYQWEGEILPRLRPLDDVLAQIAPDIEDFIPTVLTNCGQWEGRFHALPMACDVITLLYRTDVFAARSAEFAERTGRPLQPPRTWPEYVEIAKFLNSETLYGNILMGKEQTYTLWSGILYGMGGRPVDEHWRPQLHAASGVASLELFTEMFRYALPRSEDRTLPDADLLFLQGRGAMYLAWPSLIWRQLADTNRCKIAGKIGAAVIPGEQPQLSAWSLGINPACADLDAACQWLRFFVNPTNSQRLLLRYGKGSPRLSTYHDPECQRQVFYLSAVREGLAVHQPRFRIPPSQELSDYLDHELIKAIRGQSSPRAALDRTAARWREILVQSGQLRE